MSIKQNLNVIFIMLFSFFLLTACSEDKDYPNIISKEQVNGDFAKKFYRYYGSYIQLEDGKLTKTMGKVFFLKTPKGLKVAFYTPQENGFKLLDKPVLVPGTDKVAATAPPGEDVAGYILRGKVTCYIFVKNGKIITKKKV